MKKLRREKNSISLREMSDDLGKYSHLKLSHTTIKNILNENDYFSIIKRKAPKLTYKQKKKRLEFCNFFSDFETKDWGQILWSDESRISLYSTDGRTFSWIKKSERGQDLTIQETQKHSVSFCFWSCISSKGLGP